MLVYYKIIGVELGTSDEDIRRRYLELVKLHSPENDPESFRMITLAYDAIKDKRSRIRTRLFGIDNAERSEAVIKALTLAFELRRKVPALKDLIEMERKNTKESGMAE